MSLLLFLSQNISPLQCCKQPINTSKQLNLYQSQLAQPLTLSSYQKSQSIQKVMHINNFYSSYQQSNFKIVQKSNYLSLLKQCQSNHQLFIDKQFQLNQSIIHNQTDTLKDKKIIWRRLSQIYDKNHFRVFQFNHLQQQANNIQNNDNNYLTKSHNQHKQSHHSYIKSNTSRHSSLQYVLSIIKQHPKLVKQIFRNNLQQINNYGIYKLILNDYGYPKQVVIDDYVPIYLNSNQHVLSFSHNNQLWPIIVQKGISKLLGSYTKLLSLKPYQILRIITPAPTVKYQLVLNQSSQSYQNKLQTIKQALNNKFIISCTSKIGIQSRKVKSNHTYSIIAINNNSNKIQDSMITLFDPLHDQDETQNSHLQQNNSVIRSSNNSSKYTSYHQLVNIKYSYFIKMFSSFFVCYFKHNFNMDFDKIILTNRQPTYLNLNIQQTSDIVLTFSRIKRKFKQYSFINLSNVANGMRDIIGIKGGWLKLLLTKKKLNHNQQSFQYVQAQTQAQDNILSIHLPKLSPGQYIIYLQGYSQQNQQEFYSFSTYSQKSFLLKKQKQYQINRQFFLQQVMLNHCLISQKQQKIYKNYFIQNDNDSWYVSNFLYKNGGFGYIVVYVSKQSQSNVQVSIDLKKIKSQGYKLECKKVVKKYQKILKAGDADVIVLSLDYGSKKFIDKIQFPPKSIQIQIFQTVNTQYLLPNSNHRQ